MEPTGSSDDKTPAVDDAAATSSSATSNHDDAASSPVFDLTSLPLTPPREQSPEDTTQQDGSDSSLAGDNGSPHLPPALVMDCDDVNSEGDEGGEKSHGSDVVSNPGSNTERQLALRISDSSVDSLEEETKPVEPDDAIPTPITAEDQESELVTSRVDSPPSSDCGPMNGQPAVERVVAEQERETATNRQLTSTTNGQLTRTSQENSNARKHRPQSLTDGILADDDFEENVASYKVKQVAKMKRFFTTLQGFGNKMSGEVAEQVQELITALVNGTATIEEFHQEIQTITNHPLKEFIVPFLRENLDIFREELKESSQALSDILGEAPAMNAIGLTPQVVENELPVLASSKPGTAPTHTATPTSRPNPSHSTNSLAGGGFDGMDDHPVPGGATTPTTSRKRRRPSVERLAEKEALIADKVYSHPSKRSRHSYDLTTPTTPMETSVITSSGPQRHHLPPPPTYHHPPPPPPTHPHTPLAAETSATGMTYIPVEKARRRLVSEDWNHVDVMLNSLVGMVDRTRQAVTLLKERVMPELERRETDFDRLLQQRVTESVEKIKKQFSDEKQYLLLEASKQLRETVDQVRAEMEGRITQAQALAVQEALKESNVQNNSKESCWNCGRRATETCSGCNKARYCGTYCQHKDWGDHMHHCASGIQASTNQESYPDHEQEEPTIVKQEPPSVLTDQGVPVPMATSNVTMVSSGVELLDRVPVAVVGVGGINSQVTPGHVVNATNREFPSKPS